MRTHRMTASDAPARIASAAGVLVGTWKGRIALILLAAMTSGALLYRGLAGPTPPAYRTQAVARASITEAVLVSGAIDQSALVKLGFRTSGKLAATLVSVGQQVTAGQALARIDTTDLDIALRQAQANLASAQARYDLTVAGAAPEDVAVARRSVENALKAFDQTKQSTANDLVTAQQAFDRLRSAYAAAQNGYQLLTSALAVDLDRFADAIDGARSTLATSIKDLTTKATVDITTAKNAIGQADAALQSGQNVARGDLKRSLIEWTSARDNVVSAWLQFDGTIQRGTDPTGAQANYQAAQLTYTTASARFSSSLDSSSASISSVSALIASAQGALNSSTSRTDSDLDPTRADLASAQAAVTAEAQILAAMKSKIGQATADLAVVTDAVGGSYVAAQQNVVNTQQRSASAVQAAQNVYDAAVTSLARTSATPRAGEIAAAQASVLAQQAAVDKAKSDLDGATLRATSAGVVAQVNSRPGELVGGGVPQGGSVVLSDTATLTLRGMIGEADVTRVKVGQAARVTIDAGGSPLPLDGRVTSVDPVATIQLGVPVYGVDIAIARPDPAVRPGMTGTASIALASKQDVLAVPNAAIRSAPGRRFVQVLSNGALTDTDVGLGISDGSLTEVTSGLAEGQLVALPQQQVAGLRAVEPFAYPGAAEPTLERVAIVVEVTNASSDDLQISPSDFLARDGQHRIYPSDPQAAIADARLVRASAALRGINGVRPLPSITLRKDDVVVGFVVFEVPTGVRPTQLVFRQTDADRVVDLRTR